MDKSMAGKPFTRLVPSRRFIYLKGCFETRYVVSDKRPTSAAPVVAAICLTARRRGSTRLYRVVLCRDNKHVLRERPPARDCRVVPRVVPAVQLAGLGAVSARPAADSAAVVQFRRNYL